MFGILRKEIQKALESVFEGAPIKRVLTVAVTLETLKYTLG